MLAYITPVQRQYLRYATKELSVASSTPLTPATAPALLAFCTRFLEQSRATEGRVFEALLQKCEQLCRKISPHHFSETATQAFLNSITFIYSSLLTVVIDMKFEEFREAAEPLIQEVETAIATLEIKQVSTLEKITMEAPIEKAAGQLFQSRGLREALQRKALALKAKKAISQATAPATEGFVRTQPGKPIDQIQAPPVDHRFLIFRNGGRRYAVPAQAVAMTGSITRNHWLSGSVATQGGALTLKDLKGPLQIAGEAGSSFISLKSNKKTAWAVDGIEGYIELPTVRPLSSFGRAPHQKLYRGIARSGEDHMHQILVLDPNILV